MTSRLIAPSVLLVAALALVACSSNPAPAPASSSASSSPTSDASETASPPAPAPYVQSNCSVPQYNQKLDEAPTDSVELNGVFEKTGPQDIPIVTIARDLPPATELGVLELAPGTGAVVKKGDTITFEYCGLGQTTRSIFDSSWIRGEPLTYPLNRLIPGWRQGIPGMKVGGSRLLIIPGELAYGENPPAGIMPNETLVFVVSVKSIDK